MPKSKIINKSVHSTVDTSADVSIGYAQPENMIKHIKIQGSRKRAATNQGCLKQYEKALMPTYQASSHYSRFWAPYLSPFIMNQMIWESSFLRPANSSVTWARDCRQDGVNLANGCLPIKRTDKAILSSSNLNPFGGSEDKTISHPIVMQSTDTTNALTTAKTEYFGAYKYSENLNQHGDRVSLHCQTNVLDVPGGRQGVQVFWLNDKHTRRERQTKAAALGKNVGRDKDLGISLEAGGPANEVFRDPNKPFDIGDSNTTKYSSNPQYELEHDMMEMQYTNTSNTAVYIEFCEYEPQLGKSKTHLDDKWSSTTCRLHKHCKTSTNFIRCYWSS